MIKDTRYIYFYLFILVTGCTHDSTFDLTHSNDVFRGITYTSEEGELLSPCDPDDWNIFVGKSPYFAPYENSGANKTSKVGPSIIPTGHAVKPAYPNPTQDSVTITIEVPVERKYIVKLIDVNFHTIITFSSRTEAGVRKVIWDLCDSQGNKVPKGMYRAVYEISAVEGQGTFCAYGHGDIWIK